MDYNMPGLNGTQTTKKILSDPECGSPGIIMISAYTEEGSETALASLRAGAIDIIKKPSGELSFDIEKIKEEILKKVHAAARAKINKFVVLPEVSDDEKLSFVSLKSANKVVVIGASTGGPPIIEDILRYLPYDFKAAIVIAQHMPEFFTKKFAERLNRILHLWVKEAENGDELLAGLVLLAPSDADFNIVNYKGKNIVQLDRCLPGKHEAKPDINQVITAVAKSFPSACLGVVLTGMGEDGAEGMKEIKKYHGMTIAQDPETATIYSMPEAVIKAKVADEILRPEKIGKKILDLIN